MSDTEIGGIKGFLRLDDSDWAATIERAKAQAAELGRIDPNIRISVDDQVAEDRIAALQAQISALGAESANVNVRVTESGGAGTATATAVAATEALAEAEHATTAATAAATVAQEGNAAATTAAAAASDGAIVVQTRAQAAQARLTIATDTLALSQARLQALEAAGTATTTQMAAARLAVARAQQGQAAAATTLAGAQAAETAAAEAAAAANDQAAQAETAEATAATTAAAATGKLGESAGESNLRVGLLVTGVGALIAILPAATGAAAGWGAGVVGMAGAVLLAVRGANDAMKQGTDVGAGYGSALSSLRTDLDRLAGTAATEVLNGFEQVAATVKTNLPGLNDEVIGLADAAGQAGESVGTGIVRGLVTLSPLLTMVEGQVVKGAAAFEAWASGTGFQTFVNAAKQDLPEVTTAITGLATGVLHLISDFRPLGSVVIGVLDVLGDVVQVAASLGPTLPIIAAGAGAGFLAFQAWQGIIAIMRGVDSAIGTVTSTVARLTGNQAANAAATVVATAATEAQGEAATVAATETTALGGAIDFALGPIGWVIAGLGALAAITGVAMAATHSNTSATADYTSALQQDNNAIGKHTTATAVQAVQNLNLDKTAKSAGLSLSTMTEYVLGNAAAQKEVTEKTVDATKASTTWSGAGKQAAQAAGEHAVALKELKSKLDDEASSLQSSKSTLDQITTATDDATAAANRRLSPVQQLTRAEDDLTDAQDKATQAAQKWQQFVDAQNDDALKLAQATSALQGDYNSFGQTVKSNLQSMGKAQADSLDVNTAAGLQNHNMVLQSIQDAESQAAAVFQSQKEQGKSTVDATNTSNAALAASKQAIIDHATQAGLDQGAVTDLVDSLLSIPADVKTKTEVETEAAQAATAALEAELAKLQRDITINVSVQGTTTGITRATTSSTTLAKAHGGSIQAFAAGGTSGTVVGSVGSSTSDSLVTRLSLGEEVTQAYAASYPGVRPLLKHINADPAGTMQALSRQQDGSSGNVEVHLHGDSSAFMGLVRAEIRSNGQSRKLRFAGGRQSGGL